MFFSQKKLYDCIYISRYGIESSTDPCEETYKGTSPFSEKESKALRFDLYWIDFGGSNIECKQKQKWNIGISASIAFLKICLKKYRNICTNRRKCEQFNLRKYVSRLGEFAAGISVHSWGSVFLYPWYSTCF